MEQKDYFDSEQEAGEYLDYMSEEFHSRKCPVFKTQCLEERCHSFFKGSVIRLKEDGYKVYPPCCNSPLVTGIIEVESSL